MKILCTADIHFHTGVLDAILNIMSKRDIEILIMAGDLTEKKPLFNFFKNVNIPTIVVHGNWDFEIKSKKSNVFVLINDIFNYKNYYIVGLDDKLFVLENIIKKIKDIDEKKLIYVSHSPPFGILDQTWFGNNLGNIHYTNLLDVKSPLVHIFGHIHESAGIKKIGNTLFMNVAYAGSGNVYILHLPSLKVESIKVKV